MGFAEACTSSKAQVSSQGVVSCSVCLEAVTDAGERSIAKLKCGHHFHLDCIGSAFNAKGRMQCPNCRQVEHGQWLYANGCFLHEDFVDDLPYEDDVEVHRGATNVELSHTPWCPHQGSYAHFLLTLEEIENIGNLYLDPMVNLRQGSRASVAGHVCPYLAAQGLSLGGPSHRVEDFLTLQIGHHSARNTRRAASFSSSHRSRWQQQPVMSAFGSMSTSYEGPSHSYIPRENFLQLSPNRHHTAGFFGTPSSLQAGTNQGPTHSGEPGQFVSQSSHSHSAHGMQGSPQFLLSSTSRNGGSGHRRPRHSGIGSNHSQRTNQVSSSEQGWMHERAHEYGSWGPPNALGQSPNQLLAVDGRGWATENNGDSWTRGIYAPQGLYGTSSQWWAWVPPGNTHGQRGTPTMVPSAYHDGQFFGAGLFPTPTATSQGFSDHISEGGYAWMPPGFC